MLELRTVYLYGLIDQLGDEYKTDDAHVLVDKRFPSLLRKHNRISGGSSHKSNISLSPDEFLIKLKNHLNHNLSDPPNFSRISLLKINKFNFKKTAVLLQNNLNDANNSIYCKWNFMDFDVIKTTDT